MAYGDTYSCTKKKKESLVDVLCSAGYNREGLENIELEAKIDLHPKKRFFSEGIALELGEELEMPEPYSIDKVLDSSEAVHSCYAFIGEKLEHAFTKVTTNARTKIKLKGISEYIKRKDIILIKRNEKHLENLSNFEINKYISDRARESNLQLGYIGSFVKKSKEAFVFNPVSGRIFVITTNICETEDSTNKLHQLETEFYGQINGFSSKNDVYDGLAALVNGLLKGLKRYNAENSTLTKFDWLVQNIK